MNMIEVDPKLFVKCRLCLDETGQYQIVPNVQMQIKYCFDIDVEPFDSLPQLICKKCEAILSQYAGTKQIFQEKQKNLRSKINSNAKIDNIIQQQQDTVSSTQVEIENKNKIEATTSSSRKTPARSSSTETVTSNLSQKRFRKTILGNKSQITWESSYKKKFICRFCSKHFKDKKEIDSHIKRQCKLYKKYSKINNVFCLVALNKIGSKPNLTGSIENVVCDGNKIIQSKKANYYLIYSNNSKNQSDSSNSSDSSDECFVFKKKKRKRQRLISGSSTDTVVIDQNEKRSDDEVLTNVGDTVGKYRKQQISSDIECVEIDDSDSNSTKSSVKPKDLESRLQKTSEETKTLNDKMINNIIAMCYNKYMSKLNVSEEGNSNNGREESSLKHKILSIGRKVIHGKGIITTGLLRYMEHKNLEVVWIPKIDIKVTIKTRSRESRDNGNNKFCWESLTTFESHIEDFANIFEKKIANKDTEADDRPGYAATSISLQHIVCDTIERKVADNSYLRAVLDADRNWTKLLNSNPVANPKQLPKKTFVNEPASIANIYTTEVNNESEKIGHCDTENTNEVLHMPIITSTMSLAPPINREEQPNAYNNNNSKEMNNGNTGPQSMLPKIKVKPVSELMTNEALKQQQNTSTFVSRTGWTVNNETQCQNVVLQTNDNNLVYLANTQFTNVIPVQRDVVFYSQTQKVQTVELNSNANNKSGSNPPQKKPELIILHTVELPNTRTDSPFRYFQKLLEMHNLLLLDSIKELSSDMQCLTKFKVDFEQESNRSVRLCLLLFAVNNIFCIKVKDHYQKELDIIKFSANWQWEILKIFKGDDIVSKSLTSASKLGGPTYNYTNYFTSLLRSIIFSKET